MIHLLYNNEELLDEITHVKRRYNLEEITRGAKIIEYKHFKLIKF